MVNREGNIILETFLVILDIILCYVKIFFKFFIPARLLRKDVKGQVVLITGSGSGIGREMALELAKLGTRLALWDIDQTTNEDTAKVIRDIVSNSNIIRTYTVDVSNREDVYKAANSVKADFGGVDILINNAGIVTGRRLLDCLDDNVQKTMNVNILAHFWTVKAFLPLMLEKCQGHIVTVASLAGKQGLPRLVDYCTSKFAAVGFAEALRLELLEMGQLGVKTTVACPFLITSGMFEGAEVGRFNWLCPAQTTTNVARKIVEGILTNQPVVYIPSVFPVVMMALKSLVPSSVEIILAKYLGLLDCMKNFTGRQRTIDA